MQFKLATKSNSLRRQITTTTMFFTAVLSAIIALIFWNTTNYYTKHTKLQSVEFNLQLVASTINTNINNAETLLRWSVTNSTMRRYLSHSVSPALVLDAYDSAYTEYISNQSRNHILRFFITNNDDRFLQFGIGVNSSEMLTKYTLPKFPYVGTQTVQPWQVLNNDPLLPISQQCLIRYMPIQSSENSTIGSGYLALNLSAITQPLAGYELENASALYLVTNQTIWQIDGDTFVEQNLDNAEFLPLNADYQLNTSTILYELKTELGDAYIMLYPLNQSDMYIAQTIPTSNFYISAGYYMLTVFASMVFITIMGVILMARLHQTVTSPIRQLQKRINAVGLGDFTKDPSIEWNNEIGDIGRGINNLSKNIDTLMQKRLADQHEKQELEYRMLQSEINPHFIYNTLNSIRWMATIQKANGISEMVTALSRLLKSVSKGNQKLVTLQEELALLNDYFIIQQYRYGGDLLIDVAHIESEKVCRDCLIPRFSLQPIAENSIFHGIEPKGGTGSILLNIYAKENGVFIDITDNGIGIDEQTIKQILLEPSKEQQKEKFRHVGLWNVHKRLQYSFGAEYGLSVKSVIGKSTTVTVHLPLQ